MGTFVKGSLKFKQWIVLFVFTHIIIKLLNKRRRFDPWTIQIQYDFSLILLEGKKKKRNLKAFNRRTKQTPNRKEKCINKIFYRRWQERRGIVANWIMICLPRLSTQTRDTWWQGRKLHLYTFFFTTTPLPPRTYTEANSSKCTRSRITKKKTFCCICA